jgi:hypothetical protein
MIRCRNGNQPDSEGAVREFIDEQGRAWTADIEGREGLDYQGRFHFVARPADGSGEPVGLEDVRWNSEHTARRTLETMSDVELRRRLRSARNRS